MKRGHRSSSLKRRSVTSFFEIVYITHFEDHISSNDFCCLVVINKQNGKKNQKNYFRSRNKTF